MNEQPPNVGDYGRAAVHLGLWLALSGLSTPLVGIALNSTDSDANFGVAMMVVFLTWAVLPLARRRR